MKTTTILPLFAVGVLSQNFSGQPACATACLSSAIVAAGCPLSDAACQCGPTQAVIAAGAVSCLLASCTNPLDLGTAQSAGAAACAAYSATASASTGSATGSVTTSTSVTTNGTSTSTTTSATTTGTLIVETTTKPVATTTKAVGTTTAATTTKAAATSNAAAARGVGVMGVVAMLGAVVAL